MGDTEISWTHRRGTRGRSWNPVQGCALKSEGCRNCYAMRTARRFAGPGGWAEGLVNLKTGTWTGDVRLATHKLNEPLGWREPSTVFVNSMSDLFYEGFTGDQIAAVFGVMAACPQHTFIILTKRPARMRAWFRWVDSIPDPPGHGHGMTHPIGVCADAAAALGVPVSVASLYEQRGGGSAPWPLPNVWLGTSVENQDAAEERIPDLLATPAVVRLLSCEPLLGEVDLDKPRCDDEHHGDAEWSFAEDGTPWCNECEGERSYGHWLGDADRRIDWVIVGSESGPGARPADPGWFSSLRDQCRSADAKFFVKQLVVDGKLRKRLLDFPVDLQIQEFPEVAG